LKDPNLAPAKKNEILLRLEDAGFLKRKGNTFVIDDMYFKPGTKSTLPSSSYTFNLEEVGFKSYKGEPISNLDEINDITRGPRGNSRLSTYLTEERTCFDCLKAYKGETITNADDMNRIIDNVVTDGKTAMLSPVIRS